MTKNVTVKRDTSGHNRRINVEKRHSKFKAIPAILWNYEWWEQYYDWKIEDYDEELRELRCGTTVVTRKELIDALDNRTHWPAILINDGFSTHTVYRLYSSNDMELYKALHDCTLSAIPDALYRITFWYASLDEDGYWDEPQVQVDIIR